MGTLGQGTASLASLHTKGHSLLDEAVSPLAGSLQPRLLRASPSPTPAWASWEARHVSLHTAQLKKHSGPTVLLWKSDMRALQGGQEWLPSLAPAGHLFGVTTLQTASLGPEPSGRPQHSQVLLRRQVIQAQTRSPQRREGRHRPVLIRPAPPRSRRPAPQWARCSGLRALGCRVPGASRSCSCSHPRKAQDLLIFTQQHLPPQP